MPAYNQQSAALAARASWARLTPEQRRARAQHAIAARWGRADAAEPADAAATPRARQLSLADWLAGFEAAMDAQGKRTTFATKNLAHLRTSVGINGDGKPTV